MYGKEKIRQEQFLFVVKQNAGAFYRYAYSILLSRQDAEDAVSEMVLKAFEHLNDLRNLSKMKSWMFQILANTCKTFLTKRQYAAGEMDKDAGKGMDQEHMENQETYMDLRDCICGMELKFREVVILYYYEDLKVKEIAKILNVSQGTVKSRLARARGKLKEVLEE